MNIAAQKPNSKWHSPAPYRNADQNFTGVTEAHSTIQAAGRLDGEPHDLPGSHSAQFVSQDYSEQRHQAYDSQFAQPAYSGHGKVKTGSTSAL